MLDLINTTTYKHVLASDMYRNMMNAELAHRYTVDFGAFKSFVADYPGVSEPHFIQVPSAYLGAPVRLMVIGQQTKGWGNPQQPCMTVSDVLGLYDEFALGCHYRATPFWIAARQIYQALNPQHDTDGFLWSNLVKVDQAGAGTDRPLPLIEQRVCECHWLPTELEITKPDVVIFFTGPTYDDRLRHTFPGIEMAPSEFPISELRHPLLPAASFRTYHPGYLWRKKKRFVLDELVRQIRLLLLNGGKKRLSPLQSGS